MDKNKFFGPFDGVFRDNRLPHASCFKTQGTVEGFVVEIACVVKPWLKHFGDMYCRQCNRITNWEWTNIYLDGAFLPSFFKLIPEVVPYSASPVDPWPSLRGRFDVVLAVIYFVVYFEDWTWKTWPGEGEEWFMHSFSEHSLYSL